MKEMPTFSNTITYTLLFVGTAILLFSVFYTHATLSVLGWLLIAFMLAILVSNQMQIWYQLRMRRKTDGRRPVSKKVQTGTQEVQK